MASTVIDPARFSAVIFDLDGVVTDTAAVHAAAWSRLFTDYLARRTDLPGEVTRPFTADDYRRFVDGKPRYDGVRDFLASRGITLPEGSAQDGPDRATVHGLGNRKDRMFLQLVEEEGVQPYRSSVRLIKELGRAGVRTAVISASRNCARVLAAAGLSDLFEVRVDGMVAAELGLPGKPDPAVFLEAARRLDVSPDRCVVVEDALAGVQAGRSGGFALVIGVDRTGHPDELIANGADVVVSDLAEVTLPESYVKMGEEREP